MTFYLWQNHAGQCMGSFRSEEEDWWVQNWYPPVYWAIVILFCGIRINSDMYFGSLHRAKKFKWGKKRGKPSIQIPNELHSNKPTRGHFHTSIATAWNRAWKLSPSPMGSALRTELFNWICNTRDLGQSLGVQAETRINLIYGLNGCHILHQSAPEPCFIK